MMNNNNKGFALVTVLLLGSISMVLIALGAYLVSSGTMVSGVQKRYQEQVEVATGTAELVMGQFVASNLTCGDALTPCTSATVNTANTIVDPTACSANAQIFLSAAVCDALDKPNCNNLSACYLSENIDPNDADVTLVSIKIVSNSEGNESAIIDVVYKFKVVI